MLTTEGARRWRQLIDARNVERGASSGSGADLFADMAEWFMDQGVGLDSLLDCALDAWAAARYRRECAA